jgi:Undecaprenyl-phosphate galactose phosphotransferase WbaP
VGYLLLGVAMFLSKRGPVYSRGVFLIAWSLSLGALPALRSFTRRVLSGRRWWGIRCVVFGAGATSRRVIEVLTKRPEYGLKPVGVFGPSGADIPSTVCGIPAASPYDAAVGFADRGRVSYAIIADPSLPPEELLHILEKPGRHFRHILVVPELFGVSGVWATARDVGTLFGLEIRQNLLLPVPRLIKRCMDLFLILLSAPILLPLTLVLAILVRLTSPGPAFFRQRRMGQGNRPFAMWKFRTMYADSEDILRQHLERDPAAAAEWSRHHKLSDDPRVTAFGRFLRTTSLDELPQLVNVLSGEMSIVGPRPIVEAEVPIYGDVYELYSRVPPGMTGLWQISGRNSLPFGERVELDAFYVRNWSVWLDVYILTQTLPTVLRREGAF